jgi:hypothetical protein
MRNKRKKGRDEENEGYRKQIEKKKKKKRESV